MDVAEFIANYAPSDEALIRFDWNGQHSKGFVDRNMEFRETIREAVLDDMSSAPIELIRDLFRAETHFSREAWGIVDGVSTLAEALLRRGGPAYLDDYLEGKHQSFDASLGSAFKYDLPLAQTLLAEVQARLKSFPGSSKTDLWVCGEKLFADWVAECQKA